MEVTVVVGTHGGQEWINLANERAIPSAEPQAPVIHRHGETLAQARNEALALVETEWVIHLDADDQLSPDYVERMSEGTADLRGPSRQDVSPLGELIRVPYVPKVWAHRHNCQAECLRAGNWLMIGTCVKTDLARSVGGWEEFGWSEDWALWARCWRAGGTVEALPKAVYRAWFARKSRNKVSHEAGLHWHRTIEEAVFGEVTV